MLSSKRILSSLAILPLVSLHPAFAACTLNSSNPSMSGSTLTFTCDQDTDLTTNLIQFDTDQPIKLNGTPQYEPWAASMTAMVSDTHVEFRTAPLDSTGEDFIAKAGQAITVKFWPYSADYQISNFMVQPPAPIVYSSVSFSQESGSSTIPDTALVALLPSADTSGNGYSFSWKDIKSGAAQQVAVGSYIINAMNGTDKIAAIPSQLTITKDNPARIALDYHIYNGRFTFTATHKQPNNAVNIDVVVTDNTTGEQSHVSLPWGNVPAQLTNLKAGDQYSFSAPDVLGVGHKYAISFKPATLTPSADKDNYNIKVKAKSSKFDSYPVTIRVTGLPTATQQAEVSITDTQGHKVIDTPVGNGRQQFNTEAGHFTLAGATIRSGDSLYRAQPVSFEVSAAGSNSAHLSYVASAVAPVVTGWPDYIAQGH
ncbi:hypothetical protein [Dongshaea marina]|uniref:hypothetical protein n=1 Tax=Dongshaea marina TaxID=2047966 RepID=UPI000D3E3E07|nr:hypothetical protein [Dongshaea marina]